MGVREKGGQGYQPILSSFFAAIDEIGIGLVPILLEKPSFCPFGLSIPKSNLNPDIWPRPTKVKGSFYSELACTFTLTNLLKKNQPWHWTRERQEAFEDLKGAIMADLVLALPSCSLLLTYETSLVIRFISFKPCMYVLDFPTRMKWLDKEGLFTDYSPKKGEIGFMPIPKKAINETLLS